MDLNLNDRILQARADTYAWFPRLTNDVGHASLSLCGEAGEVANIVKKVERGSLTLDQETIKSIGGELADCLVYIFCLAGMLDINLEKEYSDKREFNQKRFAHRPTS